MPSEATVKEYVRVVEDVKAYLEMYYDTDIKLDEFCVVMDYSPRTVQRALKYHRTSWRYLLSRVRLIMAAENLQERDDPIHHIARDVGYSSLSHFNKAFKLFWGVSPREFRQTYRSRGVTS